MRETKYPNIILSKYCSFGYTYVVLIPSYKIFFLAVTDRTTCSVAYVTILIAAENIGTVNSMCKSESMESNLWKLQLELGNVYVEIQTASSVSHP
jgi:hypothetical protein